MALTKKMQEVLAALDVDRQHLLAAVEGISETQADYKPEPDQWSIGEIVHHLALVEEANQKLFGMMLKKATEGGAPADADPEGSVVDSINGFRSPLTSRERRVTAPERVTPLNHQPLAEGISRLNAVRAKTALAAEALGAYDLTQMVWPHPLFGDLTLYQWFLFVGLHERRHVSQIEAIRASSGFPA